MRRALTIVSLTVVSLTALAACSTEARNKYGTSGDGPAFAAYDPGLAPGGPGAGGRYKLGGPPSDSLLAAWNRDVGPDGAELPPGEGSAAEGAIVYGAKCASCHEVPLSVLTSTFTIVPRPDQARPLTGRHPVAVMVPGVEGDVMIDFASSTKE